MRESATVYFETKRRKVLAACEKAWDAHKDNCSGFLKAVLKEMGAAGNVPNVRANELYQHFMASKNDWFFMGTGQGATSLAGVCAHEGGLIVAAWKNPDSSKPGHVAVVTEYMSTVKAAKPEQRLLAYWGLLGAEGEKGEKITLSFGSAKLKDVSYFSYRGQLPQQAAEIPHTPSMRSVKQKPKTIDSIEPKDTFKFVLDTRNFEITNFWQRSNYFLVLNSGLAIGFFNLKETKFAPVLAALGVVVSMLWYFVTLGSKFWQVHWETKLRDLEMRFAKEGVLPSDLKLFSQSSSEVKSEVETSLAKEDHGLLAKFVDRQIVRKPSVTLAMTALSGIFVAAWASIFIVNLGIQMRPNPSYSLEATVSGKALGPPAGAVNSQASGPSALPASAPQLKR